MTKQDAATTTSTNTVIVCGNCCVEERRLLHHVRHRGIFRRLCTTCVLRLHPQSFCPICFLVYDRSPPNDAVTCFKCYSSSHPNCVAGASSSKTPYVCPSCVNPNLPIFTLKKVKDEEGDCDSCRSVDMNAARVLLTAARIAAISMSKAAVAARGEAERRAKEAAFTRKRAREALEHVVYLMTKEKKNHKIGNAIKIDSSSEVLQPLNAMELKEKEKLQGFKAENALSEALNSGVAMEVEDNERFGISSVSNDDENERSGDLGDLDNNKNAEGEKVRNGLPTVPLVDQQQSTESNQNMEGSISSH